MFISKIVRVVLFTFAICLLCFAASFSMSNTSFADYTRAGNQDNSQDSGNDDNRGDIGVIGGQGGGTIGTFPGGSGGSSSSASSTAGIGSGTTVANPQLPGITPDKPIVNNPQPPVYNTPAGANSSNELSSASPTLNPNTNQNVNSSKSTKNTGHFTVSSFKSYLNNYNKSDALNSGIPKEYASQAVKYAKDSLKKFNQLPSSQQAAYVNNLNKPVQNLKNAKVILKPVKNSSKIVDMHTKSGHKIRVRKVSMKGYLTPSKKIPAEMVFKVSLYYNVKGKKIKKIIGVEANVIRSLNPTVTALKESTIKFVRGNHAYAKATWSYWLGIARYGIELGTISLSVKGNYKGKLTYAHFWRN